MAALLSTKKVKIVGIIAVVLSTLGSSFGVYLYQIWNNPNFLLNKEGKNLVVATGSNFGTMQSVLQKEGYVADLISFSVLAKIMQLDKNILPGNYLIQENMTNPEVIRMLRAGKQKPVHITFSNVRRLADISQKICRHLQLTAETLTAYMQVPATAASYGFSQESFLAMFLPNTYEVYWTYTAQELVERMANEYHSFWNDARRKRAEQIGLTPIEVSTLASIVQEESSHKAEQPVIAGVYMNRLRKNIPLSADPTLIYAHGNYTIRRVLTKHKAIDSPYNTYKYQGLPPGPINAPNTQAIESVLNYASHGYFYFCAKSDFSGRHAFAKSLREHLHNAKKYQAALNKAGIYK